MCRAVSLGRSDLLSKLGQITQFKSLSAWGWSLEYRLIAIKHRQTVVNQIMKGKTYHGPGDDKVKRQAADTDQIVTIEPESAGTFFYAQCKQGFD